MQHVDWLSATAPGESVNAIARAAGIPQRTLARQLDRGHVDAENVIAIAGAYGVHPVRALIATGYLDDDAATAPDVEAALRLASDEQLTDEVLRRLRIVRDHPLYDTPVDELAARRGPVFDTGAGDVGSLPMVADSSPDHPEEDCEDYP